MITHDFNWDVDENLISEKEAATLLNMNPKTLYRWRRNGGAPKYVKLPTGSILYRRNDLQRFINDNATPSLLWG